MSLLPNLGKQHVHVENKDVFWATVAVAMAKLVQSLSLFAWFGGALHGLFVRENVVLKKKNYNSEQTEMLIWVLTRGVPDYGFTVVT